MRVLADTTFVRREQVKKQKINDTIKVGPGKPKLIYFGNQEKLAWYINSKRDCFSLALFLYNLPYKGSQTSTTNFLCKCQQAILCMQDL